MSNRRYELRQAKTIMQTAGTIIERWKPIRGFRDYQVSSLGRVRKKRNTDRHGNDRDPIFISQVLNRNGYYYVTLIDHEGKHHFKTVHRLVAMAFCGRPKENAKVSHIDGNMTNNVADNLRWNAPVEIDEEKVKRTSLRDGKSVAQVDPDTGEVVATFKSQTEAAAAAGISQSNLSRAARIGIKSGGYYWRFVINN